MTESSLPTAAPHPEEMRTSVEVRVGSRTVVQATARATPAGLLAVGALVSAILLSAAVIVRTARQRRY